MKTLIISAVMLGLGWTATHAAPAMEVLTRGPVHEAFAGLVTFNPESGPAVPKGPPPPVEELPPTERPAGADVVWIPGYWAWDDERDDYLWVSGIWRTPPPGRQWVSGYWTESPQGYQWVSGYWGNARVATTTYMPAPPATLEAGANTPAPSADHVWVPGSWVWYQGRYAWRPGYWLVGRSEWDWIPAGYVWTPRGYVYVEGYWDYAVEQRGVLFAPVYFPPATVVRYYTPSVVIYTDVFSDHLFLRPRYRHYYFGDYYAASYYSSGFFFSFTYSSYRHCYDSIRTRNRWQHRHDRDWERRSQATYQQRRDNESARPVRVWSDRQKVVRQSEAAPAPVATTLDDFNRQKPRGQRLQSVPAQEHRRLTQRDQAVQRFQAERQQVERVPPAEPATAPTQVQTPRSPITSRPFSQGREEQVPRIRRGPEPVAPAPQIQPQPAPSQPSTPPSSEPELRRDRSESRGRVLERSVDESSSPANSRQRGSRNSRNE